jgi:hypothetical protein
MHSKYRKVITRNQITNRTIYLNRKQKYIDVYRIFANEYIKRINENKTLQKCTFLMKVKNYIINAK